MRLRRAITCHWLSIASQSHSCLHGYVVLTSTMWFIDWGTAGLDCGLDCWTGLMDLIVEQKIELSNHTRDSWRSKMVPHSLLEMFSKECGNRLVTGVSRNCEKVWAACPLCAWHMRECLHFESECSREAFPVCYFFSSASGGVSWLHGYGRNARIIAK